MAPLSVIKVLQSRFYPLVLFSCAALIVSGCNPPPRPQFGETMAVPEATEPSGFTASTSAEAAASNPSDASSSDASSAKRDLALPWETWHTYFVGGKKVGYVHVKSERDDTGDQPQVLTTLEEQMALRRGTSVLLQAIRQTSVEGFDGSVRSFEAELRVGPTRTRFVGQTSPGSLKVETIRGTERGADTLEWSESIRGVAGIQQSLLEKPIRVNEQRRLRVLAPIKNRVRDVELACRNIASISTLDGEVHDAYEVDVRMTVGGGEPLESTIWVDDDGRLLKSYTPSIDLVSIRSSREDANHVSEDASKRRLMTAIDIQGRLTEPAKAFRAGYVIRPKKGVDPQSFTFKPQVGQWFRQIEGGVIQLLVSRDPKESGRTDFVGLAVEPEPADSASNAIIDANAGSVQRLAGLSRATEARSISLDLTRTVKQLIADSDSTGGFATASQVASDGAGDCTERAVLLAAMLRARRIPARVVAGLAYAEPNDAPVMAYHMWTLAWIDDRWVPFDPSTGSLAAADRIALVSSSLADGDLNGCFTTVLKAISQMDVEISNAKYQSLE